MNSTNNEEMMSTLSSSIDVDFNLSQILGLEEKQQDKLLQKLKLKQLKLMRTLNTNNAEVNNIHKEFDNLNNDIVDLEMDMFRLHRE